MSRHSRNADYQRRRGGHQRDQFEDSLPSGNNRFDQRMSGGWGVANRRTRGSGRQYQYQQQHSQEQERSTRPDATNATNATDAYRSVDLSVYKNVLNLPTNPQRYHSCFRQIIEWTQNHSAEEDIKLKPADYALVSYIREQEAMRNEQGPGYKPRPPPQMGMHQETDIGMFEDPKLISKYARQVWVCLY
jgi:hypothetical protein